VSGGARRTVVLDVVGLTPSLVGEHTPALRAFAARGGLRPLRTITPAVTCSVQATLLTGALPREHGCVANGWYFRELGEVWLWRQSNHLVGGDKLWDVARRRDPAFTVAQLFWWYNMYSSADWSVTPRPIYCADGLKLPDFYTAPSELHGELRARLGDFPLFDFWGPRAGIRSSRWIADCARHVYDTRKPSVTLVYLPHLDYDLQRFGPGDPRIARALAEVDAVCGELIEHVERDGARVIVLSEYGITAVRGAVDINRILRRAGLVAVREELGTDKLDAGASEAFAVADHQIAHVYVRRPERVAEVAALLRGVDGVEAVLDGDGKRAAGLDHPRSGELVCVSRADRWFSYYYWLDDARAPDYARTVDIHRKPGYDPGELFSDASLVKVAWVLARKKLGFRYLMDVIPLDATRVRGSHGRPTDDAAAGPCIASNEPALLGDGPVDATAVRDLILAHALGAANVRVAVA
jgi:predicted AlkP superfamily pyrophosphatase or phosphodiesterase